MCKLCNGCLSYLTEWKPVIETLHPSSCNGKHATRDLEVPPGGRHRRY